MSLTALNPNSPNQQEEGYIPGTCNIGKKEIERRKMAAIFSFIFCILFIAFMQWYEAAKIWKLLLFIPASSLGVSFQQWYFKFCVAFGIKGVFNFGNIGKTFSVEQKENYRKDRVKAWQIIVSGLGFGLLVGLLYYLLPV
ncbi:MAG: hypothetical protein ACOZCO_05115 [Bacteroidota bacterium]